jgi:pimeloyl-ACP methyl ester carboxylesterase
MRKQFTTEDGIKLIYVYNKIKSNKPTLIFLHGLGANWSQWEYSLQQARKQGFSAIAVDMRGHGCSSIPREEKSYELQKFASDIKELLEHEKINNYVLIGHSFGGSVMVTFCTEFKKNSPKAFVFIDSTYIYPYKKYHEFNENPLLCFFLRKLVEWKLIPRQFAPRKYEMNICRIMKENWLFRFFDELYYTPYNAIFKTIDGARKYSIKKSKDIITSLRNISVPTLIIASKKDKVISPDFSVAMHKIIPHSEFKLYDTAGHLFPLTDRKAFNAELFTFLSTI